jgi:hypothetical protein
LDQAGDAQPFLACAEKDMGRRAVSRKSAQDIVITVELWSKLKPAKPASGGKSRLPVRCK